MKPVLYELLSVHSIGGFSLPPPLEDFHDIQSDVFLCTHLTGQQACLQKLAYSSLRIQSHVRTRTFL